MAEKEEKETTKKAPRKKWVHARPIATKGQSILVEWNDGELKRGYIPTDEFDREKSKANETALKAAVPYGVDWSRAKVNIDLKALDQELKKNGFWTVEDLKQNPQTVNVIILRVAGLTRQTLKEIDKEA